MRRLSLAIKLSVVLGLFLAGFAISGAVANHKLKTLNASVKDLIVGPVKRESLGKDLESLFLRQLVGERRAILEKDPAALEAIFAEIEKTDADLREALNLYKELASDEEAGDLERFEEMYDRWILAFQKVKGLAEEQKRAEAVEVSRSMTDPLQKEVSVVIDELAARNEAAMESESRSAEVVYESARNAMIFTSLVIGLLGCALGGYIVLDMNRATRRVIDDLEKSSDDVTRASGAIASSSQELSHSSTEQAASLEQIAASVAQMVAMIDRNTESARRASELTVASKDDARHGIEVVAQVTSAMSGIDVSNREIIEKVAESNRRVAEIIGVINGIADKTKVIHDIVFQTKLLSFNASVEAARAGEQGKGFAVVAEEVGSLAAMSGNAAREIGDMLDASTRKVESIVRETREQVEGLMEGGRARVQEGLRVVGQAETVLGRISVSVEEVTRTSSEIAMASKEQSQGIQEINKAMSQLDAVTQLNAEASAKTADSAEALSALSHTMGHAVRVLTALMKGEEKRAAAAPLVSNETARPSVQRAA